VAQITGNGAVLTINVKRAMAEMLIILALRECG
jgi:hypothetical protein